MSTRRQRRRGAEHCEPFAVHSGLLGLAVTVRDPSEPAALIALPPGRRRALVEAVAR